MTAVDWAAFQKCPVCPALLGEACIALSGSAGGEPVRIDPSRPHTGRKLRAGR